MTHKQRILTAARGEMPDRVPYVPRIDLWYTANSLAGTLPPKHRGQSMDEISRAHGWGLHKLVPEFLKAERPDATVDRGIGIYRLKECPYLATLPEDVERRVTREGRKTVVEYVTPLGRLRTVIAYTEEMEASGASITWIEEHVLKGPEDYRVLGHIFRNTRVEPAFEPYRAWQADVGEDGVAAGFASLAASPLHHIMREFLDATEFYYHFHDYRSAMEGLIEDMEPFYGQILEILAQSPAETVLWGANYDDTITPSPLFEQYFTPWLSRASERLRSAGKITISHCDGENHGLLDLIRDSGMDVAEAICPHPMTQVTVGEYYARWRDRLTIFGGIPSSLLLESAASDQEFESYMRDLFQAIVPGDRFILGVADTTPPQAKFERLIRAGELAEELGELPLRAGGEGGATALQQEATARRAARKPVTEAELSLIGRKVVAGDQAAVVSGVKEALEQGRSADDILHHDVLPAMDVVGERFRRNDVFIPEVLLSARAVNEALKVLEPLLARGEERRQITVLLGTVHGDMHDIGKNLLAVTFKGVGMQVVDLGINVPTETFVRKVEEVRPQILGMSALLTTTMPAMAEAIEALKARGLRDRVKVIVGGAPVNESFARKIEADGYADNAGDAVALVRRLMEG